MSLSDSSSQLRRGALVPIVLAVLEDGPAYGLEVVKSLRAAADIFNTPEGTIYPLLNRLEAANLISSEWVVQAGLRPRRYYALTSPGRDELAQFRQEWLDFEAAMNLILNVNKTTSGDDRDQ